MSDRDTLAEALKRTHLPNVYRELVAVIMAGWRPPPRVITDPAELHALPVGSIVFDHANPRDAYIKRNGDRWFSTGSSLSATAREALLWGEGRVTVAYVPTEEGDR